MEDKSVLITVDVIKACLLLGGYSEWQLQRVWKKYEFSALDFAGIMKVLWSDEEAETQLRTSLALDMAMKKVLDRISERVKEIVNFMKEVEVSDNLILTEGLDAISRINKGELDQFLLTGDLELVNSDFAVMGTNLVSIRSKFSEYFNVDSTESYGIITLKENIENMNTEEKNAYITSMRKKAIEEVEEILSSTLNNE